LNLPHSPRIAHFLPQQEQHPLAEEFAVVDPIKEGSGAIPTREGERASTRQRHAQAVGTASPHRPLPRIYISAHRHGVPTGQA